MNNSISGMLQTNELFLAPNASFHHNHSGFQVTQNASNGTGEDQDGQKDSPPRGMMIAFHSTVAAVILIGNLLVLFVISKKKSLQVRAFTLTLHAVMRTTNRCSSFYPI